MPWFLALLVLFPLVATGGPATMLFDGDVRGVLGGRRGRVAQSHAAIAARRESEPDLLLVSSGSVLGPSPVSEVDGGATMVELMNQAKYDVMALGRKDLFAGKRNALDQLAKADFPVLATNLRLSDDAADLHEAWARLQPWVRLTRGGESFLFFGGISEAATTYGSAWDPTIEVRPLVPSLKAAKAAATAATGPADRYVLLGTMGFRDAVTVLKELPWIDLVVTNKIGVDEFLDYDTFEFRMRDGRAVVWTEVFGRSLGEADFGAGPGATLSSQRFEAAAPQRTKVSGRVATAPEDRAVSGRVVVAPEDRAVSDRVAVARAEASVALAGTLGSLTDAEVADFPQAIVEGLRVQLGAEVGVLHRGSVMTDLEVPRVLTRQSLRQMYPYTDHGAFLTLTGSALRQLWETRSTSEQAGRHLLFAGVEERHGYLLINGRVLKDKDSYRVATVDFLTLGGFGPLLAGKGRVHPERSVDLLEKYFARPDRAAAARRLATRHILRQRTRLDFSQSRLDFDGAASAYQYAEPNTTYVGSDIPGLVGLAHKKVDIRLDHQTTLDRQTRDELYRLKLAFSEFSPNFKDLKSVDQASFSARWEEKSPGTRGPRWFGSFDLTSAIHNPALPGQDRPLFLRGVAGLQWKRGQDFKLYAGFGRIARLSTPGDPVAHGLNLGYTHSRRFDRDRLTWSSELDGFWSEDSDKVRTFQATNELRARLTGNLSTVFRHTFFLWRDSSLNRSATREETFVGLGLDLVKRRH